MKKDYNIRIKSIKTWNGWNCCYNYTNTAEAFNYFIIVLASEKEFGLVVKRFRKDKLILNLYCDDRTYNFLKMKFICDQGDKFEWID